MARKIIKIQKTVKTQLKTDKECSKMMQELKDDIAILKKDLTEILDLKYALQELHKRVGIINIGINQAGKGILELEDQSFKSTQSYKNKEKIVFKWIKSPRSRDYVKKKSNLRFIDIPERGERVINLKKNIFEDINQKNFPNVTREVDIQIQRHRENSGKILYKKTIPEKRSH